MAEAGFDLNRLKGQRLLILEDAYFLSDETRRTLHTIGAIVLGPVASAKAAIAILQDGRVDGVIFDLHLPMEEVLCLADELDAREIPYLFARAEDPARLTESQSGFIFCEKPAELEEIGRALFGQRRMNG